VLAVFLPYFLFLFLSAPALIGGIIGIALIRVIVCSRLMG
jgi:hypothetical protein